LHVFFFEWLIVTQTKKRTILQLVSTYLQSGGGVLIDDDTLGLEFFTWGSSQG
jgi:hypothetical protein